MGIIFEQIGILFVFITFGYIFGKFNIVKKEHSKIISVLCVNFFLPCMIFKSVSRGFTREYMEKYYILVIISIVILFVLIVFAHFLSKLFSRDPNERKVYNYTLIVPNYGYMGYALAEGIFGTTGLLNMIVFGAPVTTYTYSVGYAELRNSKIKFKTLLIPTMFALVLGVAFGLSGIQLPVFFSKIIESGSACMSPLAMLLTGITISEFDLKELLLNKKAYIIVLLRLIVIPFLIMLCLKPFFAAEIVRTATLLYAMPCGLNTVVVAKAYNQNYKLGASFALISSLAGIITIPLILLII